MELPAASPEDNALANEVVDQPTLLSGEATVNPTPEEMAPPPSRSTQRPLRKAAVDSVDYRRLWMKNDIAAVVVHIETGQVLSGNEVFMK